eukprot:6384605-Prymnesium_polylepis.1
MKNTTDCCPSHTESKVLPIMAITEGGARAESETVVGLSRAQLSWHAFRVPASARMLRSMTSDTTRYANRGAVLHLESVEAVDVCGSANNAVEEKSQVHAIGAVVAGKVGDRGDARSKCDHQHGQQAQPAHQISRHQEDHVHKSGHVRKGREHAQALRKHQQKDRRRPKYDCHRTNHSVGRQRSCNHEIRIERILPQDPLNGHEDDRPSRKQQRGQLEEIELVRIPHESIIVHVLRACSEQRQNERKQPVLAAVSKRAAAQTHLGLEIKRIKGPGNHRWKAHVAWLACQQKVGQCGEAGDIRHELKKRRLHHLRPRA